MSEAYEAVLTGGLSLKGGLFKSKKKKKNKRKREEEAAAAAAVAAREERAVGDSHSEHETAEEPVEGGEADASLDNMLTPAQKRFRETQQRREAAQIKQLVSKTHRERVEDFNALLASKTEHNDIPRCSAAGNG